MSTAKKKRMINRDHFELSIRAFSDQFCSYPDLAQELAHSSGVTALRALAMVVSRASTVLAALLRKALILTKACSIGVKSGEYGGRNSRVAPAALMTSRVRLTLLAGYFARGAGFVEKNQLFRIELGLRLSPDRTIRLHIFAVLLTGMRCVFLNDTPWRRKKSWVVDTPKVSLSSQIKRSRSSARVMLGACWMVSNRTSCGASIRPERRSPPRGLGRC